jgi:glycosyltransferase involved in cell wall biosynthesis
LESTCDCFVSLHRSEGFGLGLAEAMYQGKPVIGTDWSGNTDFMNAENSCPVRYSLERLDQSFGPYSKGQTWAEPDSDHAAWFMRRLVEDDSYRRRIAAAGQETIRSDYSPRAVGRRYLERLALISRLI